MPQAPLFLYGFARSGTTLLTLMVGKHPRIALPISVVGLWYAMEQPVLAEARLATPDSRAALVDELLAHDRIQRWNTALDRDWILDQLRPDDYPSLVAAFHGAFAKAEDKPVWANMDIATLSHLERAAHWFPKARFVHIVRDGRDVALSHATMRYSEGNTLEIAQKWSAAVEAAERIGALLGADRHLSIRYESLIEQPEATLSRVCSFLGQDYDPAMLRYAETVDQRIHPDKRDLWPAIDKPPQQDRVSRWRREMSARQLYVFEDIAGPSLSRLGYVTASRGFSLLGEIAGATDYLTRGSRLRRLLARFRPSPEDG